MQFATPRHTEHVGIGGVFHAQGNVGEQFAGQAVADLARSNEFAFRARQRAGVHHKVHGQSRLVHAQHRHANGVFLVANGYADADFVNARNNHNIARLGFVQRHALQAFEAEQLVDAPCGDLFIVVHHGNLHPGADFAVQNAPNAKATGVVVIIQLRNLQLQGGVGIAAGLGRVFQNGFKQHAHIGFAAVFFQTGKAAQTRCVHNREIQLLIACAQAVKQFKGLVNHPAGAGGRFVDFVNHHNRAQTQRKGFFGNEAGLRHRAFLRVHQQHHAVHHAEHALHFAAKIGVPRSIDDVDMVAVVFDGGVFGENGDTALFFQVVAVHHALFYLLVGAESARLAQQLVNKGGFAVVHVGDDGDVADVFHGDGFAFLIGLYWFTKTKAAWGRCLRKQGG